MLQNSCKGTVVAGRKMTWNRGTCQHVKVRVLRSQPENPFYVVKEGSDLLKDLRMLKESLGELKKQALEWACRNNPQNLTAQLAGKGVAAPEWFLNHMAFPPSVRVKWMLCPQPASSHKSLQYLCFRLCIWLAEPKSHDSTLEAQETETWGSCAFYLGKMGFTPWGTIVI